MTWSIAAALLPLGSPGPRHLQGGRQHAHRRRASSVSNSMSSTVSSGKSRQSWKERTMPEGAAPRAGSRPGSRRRAAPSRPDGRHQARHGVEQGGLARPVGPDEPHDGAGLGRQVGAVDGPHPAEGHRPGPRMSSRAGPRRPSARPRGAGSPGHLGGRPGRAARCRVRPGARAGDRGDCVPQLLDARGDQVTEAVQDLGHPAGQVEDEGQEPEPAGEELDGRGGPEDGGEAHQVEGARARPRRWSRARR